jgi:hypothetical protein
LFALSPAIAAAKILPGLAIFPGDEYIIFCSNFSGNKLLKLIKKGRLAMIRVCNSLCHNELFSLFVLFSRISGKLGV